MLFGPDGLMGSMAMFVSPLTEEALWFSKGWATGMMMVVLGPYLFGFPTGKVVKQLTAAYIAFVLLFAYGLFFTEVFNFPIVASLTGVNFLFFVWGLYLVLTSDAGEDML